MSTVAAGVPFYLKIAEIKGDARSQNHTDEIEIRSWSWGETQSVFPSEARKTGGSVSMRDFSFTANVGSATPQFLLHCASAKRLKSAILTCEHDLQKGGGRQKYLVITLSNVVIGSFDIESEGDEATTRFTLKFTKIEFAFTPPGGGNYTATWDLSLNATSS